MCLILDGEIRQVDIVKTKKGEDLTILRVLAKIGKSEQVIQVANFSDQIIKAGKIKLSVVPRVNVNNGRGYLNYATYDGAI